MFPAVVVLNGRLHDKQFFLGGMTFSSYLCGIVKLNYIIMNREEKVIHLYTVEKKSINKIRAELRCDKKWISEVLRNAGVQLRHRVTWDQRNPSKEETEKFQLLYDSGKSLEEIGDITGWSKNTVSKYLEAKLESRPYIGVDKVLEIQRLYKELGSSRKVAQQLGVSKYTVLQYAKDVNDPSSYRKYTCNSNFFDDIDCQNKAYWLGIMITDGSISSSDNSVTLSSTDEGMLKAFIKVLESDYPISIYERSKENPKWKDTYVVRIFDEHLKDTLIKQGVNPNKVRNVSFPQHLDKALRRHFIRGMFDGDGSVWITEKGRPGFSITGYLPFMAEVQEVLIKEAGVTKTKLAQRKEYSGDIRYGGKENLQKLYDYLYKDARCFLKRKRDKFKEIVE